MVSVTESRRGGLPMPGEPLLDTLRRLEVELHGEATRRDTTRMDELLHPEFEEFGRSGRRFTRQDTLAEFTAPGTRLPPVVADGFRITTFGDRLALLTYVSAHLDRSGHPYRYTLRSSLWVLTADGWQMRFHQGTPTDGLSENAT